LNVRPSNTTNNSSTIPIERSEVLYGTENAKNLLLQIASQAQRRIDIYLVIRFVLSQKQRIDRQEITRALRNYIKALKLFCKMNTINIFWEVISRSLPQVKQHANDRIPIVEEIKKLFEYPDRFHCWFAMIRKLKL
jgi:hypothetical protein